MQRTSHIVIVIGVFAALAGLTACERGAGGPIGVSPAAIADDPGAYYGSRVTVSGQVGDVHSPGTFTIGGEEFDAEILVLSVDSIGIVSGRSAEQPIRRGDIVQATGIVRPFLEIDLTDHYGFDPTVFEDTYGDRPAIVARSIGARLGHIVVTPRGADLAAPGDRALLTDFSSVVGDDGRNLIGRTAHFSDVTAVETVGENAFWGSVESESLFVVLVPGSTGEATGVEVDTSSSWELYGILRGVPPSNELAVEWDLNEQTISRLENDEVFLEAIHAIEDGSGASSER